MYLRSLKLFKFRNLEDQEIEFSPGLNFITGQNGQGKTNLIEAVYLLSLGRSFRTSKSAELMRHSEQECSVFGMFSGNDEEFRLGLVLSAEGREAYLNQQKLKGAMEMIGKVAAICFSPSDLELIKGGPKERRSFLDKHISELNLSYVKTLVDYLKALRSKASLLKIGITDPSQYEPWEKIMAAKAVELSSAREKMVAELEREAQGIFKEFSESDGELKITLRSNIMEDGRRLSEQEIIDKINTNREKEIRSASVMIGPHRDDLLISIGDHSARAYASQGQTRSIVLALKIGILKILQLRRSDPPLVLLDDVDSELDSGRREVLYRLIHEAKSQVLITGTEIDSEVPKASISASFSIKDGVVKNDNLTTR